MPWKIRSVIQPELALDEPKVAIATKVLLKLLLGQMDYL
jgi:hypothetical protein